MVVQCIYSKCGRVQLNVEFRPCIERVEMAVKKSLFLLVVILAFVLLTSLDMAYANVVTEANGLSLSLR
jgi:uncharacterized membrane protein (DUF485 family)